MGCIDIFASGNKAEIKNISKDHVKPFAEYVRARITGTTIHASAPALSHVDDPVKKLTQIKEMLDAGLINQAEYDTKKSEILSRM